MKQINLAPPEDQFAVKFMALQRLGFKAMFICVAVLAAGLFAAAVSIWYTMEVKKNALLEIKQLEAQEHISDYGKVRDQVKNMNNFIGDANVIFSQVPKLSRALESVLSVLPQNLTIQSMSFDTTKRQLVIAGFSPTRQSVILLHQNLASKKEFFEYVDYPLENLIRPKNVQFHFMIKVAQGVLK